MDASAPYQFRHTNMTSPPVHVIGITLLDEKPGYTGIYMRDANGGLWPCRTVRHKPASHHRDVCKAWLSRKGIHQDKRSVRP